jgi:glycosyltransferase involved in cell wall biosynthesis
MDKPLISVIVPAYNIAPYICRCLDSLLCQTYGNLEIIVIDDGSNDETGNIIDAYAESDRRIKAIHKDNSGVSETRNVGIEVAVGTYIGFVDGDDTVDQDIFDFLYQNLVRYNADISHCGYRIVREGRENVAIHGTHKIVVQDRNEGIIDLLDATMVEPGIWNKLYRRDLVKDVRLDKDIKINEDLLFNIRLFKMAKKSIFIDEPKYNYILRQGSASQSSLTINKIENPLTVMERICELFEDDTLILPFAKSRWIATNINSYKALIKDGDKEKYPYLKKVKQFLKNHRSEINNNAVLSRQMKWQAWLIVYVPAVYRAVYMIYEKVTSGRNHYEV